MSDESKKKERDYLGLKCVYCQKEAEYVKDGMSFCENHFKQYIQKKECLPKAQNTSNTKEMLFLGLGVVFGATLGYLGSIIGAWQFDANKNYPWFIYVVYLCVALFIAVLLLFGSLTVYLWKKRKLGL